MLVKCLECNGLISDKAFTCPHCGATVTSLTPRPKVDKLGIALIISGMLIMIWGYIWNGIAEDDFRFAVKIMDKTGVAETQAAVDHSMMMVFAGCVIILLGCVKAWVQRKCRKLSAK